MAPVVTMLVIIFCAVAAFMRVEPETTSGPTSATIDRVRGIGQRSIWIAGDAGGLRAQSPRIGDRRNHIGRAPAGGEADDHIFAAGTAAGDVALAQLFGVFIDLDRRGERLGSAGHDVLHGLRAGGEVGGNLAGIERGEASAGTGADIDEAAALAKGVRHHVDHLGDLRQRLLDRSGDLLIFLVDDAGDLDSRPRIEPAGRLVGLFGQQVLNAGSRAVGPVRTIDGGLRALGAFDMSD